MYRSTSLRGAFSSTGYSYRARTAEATWRQQQRPFFVGPIRYAHNLEAIAELWIHMNMPSLGARDMSRMFWFSHLQ
jgi:hypothetical protein